MSEYDRLIANQATANTEMLLAFDENHDQYLLLKEGVSQSDIVLAFHHPDDRPLTDFAVA